MRYHYKDYNHPRFSCFKTKWPSVHAVPGGTLIDEPITLAFFDRLNAIIAANGSYTVRDDDQYRALGNLPAHSHVRFFCPRTGEEFGTVSTLGGEAGAVNAAELVKTAFVTMGYEVWNRRGIRPLRVREATVIHVVVDADVRPIQPQPGIARLEWVRSYEGELAMQ